MKSLQQTFNRSDVHILPEKKDKSILMGPARGPPRELETPFVQNFKIAAAPAVMSSQKTAPTQNQVKGLSSPSIDTQVNKEAQL